MIKQKGFQDYLNDDPSLTEKITYEEFMNKKATPKDNEEISIEDAYDSYCRVLEAKNSQ